MADNKCQLRNQIDIHGIIQHLLNNCKLSLKAVQLCKGLNTEL